MRGPRGQSAMPSQDEDLARPPLDSLLANPATWAFILGKFLTDPAWWFYLFWLPGFLNRVYGLDLAHLGLPIIVVYQASTVGSIGGGWISATLVKRGWAPGRARDTAMLVCAIAVTSVMFIGTGRASMWLAVALKSIATAAHQGWSANLYTLASDLFPRGAVGSVVGLGGLGGALGGMLVAPLVGYWLDWSHGGLRAAVRNRGSDLPGCVRCHALAVGPHGAPLTRQGRGTLSRSCSKYCGSSVQPAHRCRESIRSPHLRRSNCNKTRRKYSCRG